MSLRDLAFNIKFDGMDTGPLKKINDGMDKVKEKAKGLGDEFKKTEIDFDKLAKGMGTSGKKLTKGVTMPLVGIGTAAIATVSNFDDSMSQVGAIASDLSEGELTDLRDMAKELGSTTAHSASAAADGMSTLAAAGYDFDQIYSATPEVLSLASAGMLELDQAAGILTGTMAMFSLDATDENFQRVADVTAKAASSSKTSVEEIGSAMDMAGGAAASMNMDIEQTNAVLGVFANQNIVGGRAGTVFTAMQSDLASSAENGALAIADQTVAVYDSEGAWRDMGSIMGDIESATDGMSNAQRDKILMDTFGVQSMKGVNAMLTEGADGYGELEGAMYDSNGAAAQMAEDMEDNIGGAFRGMKSAIEGLMIEIGDVLKGPVQDAAEFIGGLAGKFGELDGPTKEMIVKFAVIAAAIGPVLVIGSKLIGGIKMIGGAIAFLISPVGLAIAAAVALGAGLVYLWHTNEDFRDKVIAVWDAVTEKVSEAVQKIKEFWDEHGEQIKTTISETFERVKEIISGALETVREVVSSALTWIGEFWDEHGETIKSATSSAWELITSVIDGAMSVIQGVIDVVLGVIQGDWSRVWVGIQGIFEGVMTAIGVAWNVAKEIVGAVISGTVDAITDKFHTAIDKVKEVWNGLKTFFANPIKGTVDLAKSGWNKLTGKADGSHASGAYRIPFDGYLGELHKNEMVLTASASDQFRAMGGTENSIPTISNNNTSTQATSNNSTSTSFSPVVNVTIEGNASDDNVRDLERMMKDVFRREQESFFNSLSLQQG